MVGTQDFKTDNSNKYLTWTQRVIKQLNTEKQSTLSWPNYHMAS